MDISIIIPVYNTDIKKLKRCLSSVKRLIKHSNLRIECIIVDDGSDDYVERFCHSVIAGRSNYIYIKKNNGGVSSARNIGIEKSNGKYILFIDADDALLSNQTAEMMERYINEDVDIVFSDLVCKKNYGWEKWRAFSFQDSELSVRDVLSVLSKSDKLNGPVCKLIRTNYIKEHNIVFPSNMINGEDAVFLYSMMEYHPKVSYYSDITYKYYNDYKNTMRFITNAEHVLTDDVLMYKNYMQVLASSKIKASDKNVFSKNYAKRYIKRLFYRFLDAYYYKLMSPKLQDMFIEAADLVKEYKIDTGKIYDVKYCIMRYIICSKHNKTAAYMFLYLRLTLRKIKAKIRRLHFRKW